LYNYYLFGAAADMKILVISPTVNGKILLSPFSNYGRLLFVELQVLALEPFHCHQRFQNTLYTIYQWFPFFKYTNGE
jgi:hypothetical protein